MQPTMTPPSKSMKRAQRSPLNEMDGDELEPDESEEMHRGFTVAQMANVVRSEIQRALAPVELQLSHMNVSLGQKVDEIESAVVQQGLRIEKLENMMVEQGGTPRSTASERSAALEGKINDLQSQLAMLKASDPAIQPEHVRTMVVGGLEGLASIQNATTWLTNKLSTLHCPPHIGSYIKSQEFRGPIFAKFRSSIDRDTAVALLRSVELHEHGKRVWATQDLPLAESHESISHGIAMAAGRVGFHEA